MIVSDHRQLYISGAPTSKSLYALQQLASTGTQIERYTMKHIVWGVAASTMVLILASAAGAQSPAPTLEIFNSFKYFEQAGDLAGMEVILMRTRAGACVSYQDAEDERGKPRIVPADIRGDSLFFTVPPDSGFEFHITPSSRDSTWTEATHAMHFSGRMSAAGLRVYVNGRQPDPDWLPRRRRAYFPESARKLSNLAPEKCAIRAHIVKNHALLADSTRLDLSGTWDVVFHVTERGRVHDSTRRPTISTTVGRMQLSQFHPPPPDQRSPSYNDWPRWVGVIHAPFSSLLQVPPQQFGSKYATQDSLRVGARIDSGRIRLDLVATGCSDCGDIEAMGSLRSDDIGGRWSQEFFGTGDAGTWSMHRVKSANDDKP